MKLLCINAKQIRVKSIIEDCHYELTGDNLVEGNVYETLGKEYRLSHHNMPVYYIIGIGARCACRFTEVLESSFISKKSLEEITLN